MDGSMYHTGKIKTGNKHLNYNNMIEPIKLSKIQPGYLLFLNGKSFLAKRIKWFQKLKYGKDSYYFLNHVGFFDNYIDGCLLVYEQDQPGRFQPSPFDEEYLANKEDVYIGIPKCDLKNFANLREDAEVLAGADVLLNYSYKSFLSFMADAISFKLFKKDCWLTGEPTGSTCSQITAKLYQKYFSLFLQKKWYKWFPCEIAQSNEIEIRKLIY